MNEAGVGCEGMQLKYHMITIEDLVPQDHFLRKLEAALDLTFVYEEMAHLYSRRYGRPPIDPVVIIKYLLVGFLYGIPSERQIEERYMDSNAFRWYLGIDLDERVPDHSTISQLRRRKPTFRKVFRRLFEEVGLETLKTRTGGRRKKRTRKIKKDTRRTKKRVSRTDPEAGHMKRPGKPRGQYYLSHQTLDSDHGIIIGLTVTPGDVHDTVPYLEQVESVHQRVIPLRAAAADSAYDFPLAHRELEKLGIDFFVRPQPAHDRTKVELKRDAFTYDAAKDVYICPNGNALRPKGLYRSDSGLFWEYWADKKDCGSCPLREKCLSAEDHCLLSAVAMNLKRMIRCLN